MDMKGGDVWASGANVAISRALSLDRVMRIVVLVGAGKDA